MPTTAHRAHETLEGLLVPLEDLEPHDRNPRRGNLSVIAESLKANGQYRPVVANRRTSQILAGNHTWQAARKLGWSHIAVTWVDVDEETATRIMLVDNRANDLAGYDDAALLAALQVPADLYGTGFTDEDLAALLAEEAPGGRTGTDDVPDKPAATPLSRTGDVWLLGKHRLLVGDATDRAAVLDMLDGDLADCVWTDPPYGVSYVGKTKDALTIQGDGQASLSELLPAAFATVVAACKPGAPVYVAHADTERVVFEQSLLQAGLLVRQNLVWVKDRIVLGRSDYHYRHEPILQANAPGDPEVEEDLDELGARDHEPVLYGFTPGGSGRLGRGGPRWQGDNKAGTVFEVAKPQASRAHPTMKPTDLITAMLNNSCRAGGLVLDVFGGSGSTLIAAHHHKARAALVELDPAYADVIARRWQEHTGVLPVRRSDGEVVDFTEGDGHG